MPESLYCCSVCRGKTPQNWGDADIVLCEECRELFIECSHCGRLHRQEELAYGTPEFPLCDTCESNFFTCPICERILHTNLQTEGGICSRCLRECNRNFHDYNYKPKPKFHGFESPYYGIELETDGYNYRDDAIYNITINDPNKENYYLKKDGSLNYGVEIVFHPRSIQSWIQYEHVLDKIVEIVERYGGKSFHTKTCGLHIHRCRKDVSEVTLAKLLILFVKLRSQIERISQRKSNRYADYTLIEREVDGNLKLIYKALKDGEIDHRYCVLNITNKDTIEFRGPKGTLRVSTILALIQFFHTLVQFAKDTLISDIVIKPPNEIWNTYRSYIKKFKPTEVEYLIQYLERKGM